MNFQMLDGNRAKPISRSSAGAAVQLGRCFDARAAVRLFRPLFFRPLASPSAACSLISHGSECAKFQSTAPEHRRIPCGRRRQASRRRKSGLSRERTAGPATAVDTAARTRVVNEPRPYFCLHLPASPSTNSWRASRLPCRDFMLANEESLALPRPKRAAKRFRTPLNSFKAPSATTSRTGWLFFHWRPHSNSFGRNSRRPSTSP